MIEVRPARPDELPAAEACYRRNGYGGTLEPADRALVALAEREIVGVVRLVEEEGHQLLRGFFLDEDRRGAGLGRRMLQALVALLEARPCWLVCGPHLIAFYGEAGFRLAHDEEAPPHLQERVLRYRRTYGPQCLLRRPGDGSPAPEN